MRQEILAAKGQLAEYRQRLANLEIEGSGLVTLIRNLLNPYEEDISALRVDEAEVSVTRLQGIVHDLRSLKVKIAKLESDLGDHARG